MTSATEAGEGLKPRGFGFSTESPLEPKAQAGDGAYGLGILAELARKWKPKVGDRLAKFNTEGGMAASRLRGLFAQWPILAEVFTYVLLLWDVVELVREDKAAKEAAPLAEQAKGADSDGGRTPEGSSPVASRGDDQTGVIYAPPLEHTPALKHPLPPAWQSWQEYALKGAKPDGTKDGE